MSSASRDCRICGFSLFTNRHHVIPRSLRGSDDALNVVRLCYQCHSAVDSNKPARAAFREQKRRALRAALTVEEVAYVDSRMGRGWLDRHYPLADDAVHAAHLSRSGSALPGLSAGVVERSE